MRDEAKILLRLLALWFLASLAVGLTGWFQSAAPPVMAATVWGLTFVALLSCWKIPSINQWVNDTSVAWLLAIHLLRFVGIYFVILCHRQELSCSFGRPAGMGDTAIAVGAVLLLFWSRSAEPSAWRIATLIWNTLGLLDIVLVVFVALRAGLHDSAGMAPLRTLPLMLLPTFLVPLIIVSHVVIFVRLAKQHR